MTRLAQYLAERHPNAGQPGDSTEDKSIAVMREMDERIERLVSQLRIAHLYVLADTRRITQTAWARKDLAAIDALLAETSK